MSEVLWNIIEDYGREYKKFPSVAKLREKTGINGQLIIQQYRKWYKEGKIDFKSNRYAFKDDYFVEDEAEEEKKSEVKPKRDLSAIAMKLFSGIIASFLTIISVHFTFEFNKMMLPTFWAFLMSLSVVLFMSSAFALKSFMNSKFSRQIIVVLWFLGISYSVFTAVSGQFNSVRKYDAADKTSIVSEQKEIINDSLKSLKKKESQLLHWREQESLYTADPNLKTENPGTWRSIKKGIIELEKTESEIRDCEQKLISLAGENTKENRSVYEWISEAIGIKVSLIQFFMILFPSVFIDLCSTLLFGFAFGKSKDDENKN